MCGENPSVDIHHLQFQENANEKGFKIMNFIKIILISIVL